MTGHLWIGDVGQNLWEEISRVHEGGLNLGWRIQEGGSCFNISSANNPLSSCTTTGLTAPARSMQRSQAKSITGGTFFTGDPTSAYHNVYIFGDYVENHVWAMRPTGGTLTDSVRIGQVFNVSSFERDSHGRVFATSLSNSASVAAGNGVVFILESPDMRAAPVSLHHARRAGAARLKPLRVADLRRNPDAYEWRSLDGSLLSGTSNALKGAVWVRPKGSNQAAQLVMMVW